MLRCSVIPAYSSVSGPDRDFVVDRALAGKLSFPGDSTQGVYAGFQVTPSLTYVLNGEEPADQPERTVVYSIDDGDIREYSDGVWKTRDRDFWASNPDDAHGRFFPAMTKLKDGRIMRIAGFDETFSATTYCSIFDPSNRNLGWVPVAPFPGAQIPCGMACTLKNGKVLFVGGLFNADINPIGLSRSTAVRHGCTMSRPTIGPRQDRSPKTS